MLPAPGMYSWVHYVSGQDVVSAHLSFTNAVTDFPPLSVDVVVYGNDKLENGTGGVAWSLLSRRACCWLELWCTRSPKLVSSGCSRKSGCIIQDSLPHCLTSTRGQSDVNRMFVVCKAQCEPLVKVCTIVLLYERSELTGDESMKNSARLYLVTVNSQMLVKALDDWASHPGLLFLQTVQEHAVSCQWAGITTLCLMLFLLYSSYPEVLKGRSGRPWIDKKVRYSCSAMEARAINFTIGSKISGMGCFAAGQGTDLEAIENWVRRYRRYCMERKRLRQDLTKEWRKWVWRNFKLILSTPAMRGGH